MWEDNAVLNNYELKSKREKISAAKIALSSGKINRYPNCRFKYSNIKRFKRKYIFCGFGN